MDNAKLENIIKNKKTLVLCGSGGVGKTSLAASLAMHAACLGRKVLVVTIDPAQRLANALGIDELNNEEKLILEGKKIEAHATLSQKKGAGKNMGNGALYAMMLNPKRTFDILIEKHALNEDMKNVIFNNPVYKHGSEALIGSPEYMAMEKLYELHNDNRYDLIVLDTPPTKHALDFLSAPGRMISFIEENKILNYILNSGMVTGRAGLKLFIHTGTMGILKIIERLTDSDFLMTVMDFINAFEQMIDGFKQRAINVKNILKDDSTSFVIIASPNIISIREGIHFKNSLSSNEIPFGGFIVNRVHRDLMNQVEDSTNLQHFVQVDAVYNTTIKNIQQDDSISPELKVTARKLIINFILHQIIANIDQSNINKLKLELRDKNFITQIPYFERDIYSFEGLQRINDYLFSEI